MLTCIIWDLEMTHVTRTDLNQWGEDHLKICRAVCDGKTLTLKYRGLKPAQSFVFSLFRHTQNVSVAPDTVLFSHILHMQNMSAASQSHITIHNS